MKYDSEKKRFIPGFRDKLVVMLSILLITISYLVNWNFINQTRKILHSELKDKSVSIAQSLTSGALYGILIQDADLLGTFIADTMKTADINYVMILLPSGKILAHSDSTLNNSTLNDAMTVESLKTDKLLTREYHSRSGQLLYDISVPVFGRSENQEMIKYGVIRLEASTRLVEQKIDKISMTSITITMLAVSIGIGLLLYWVNILIRPLTEMGNVVKKIADGDFTQQLTIRSDDEIGHLGVAFLSMSERTKSTLLQIKEVAATLGEISKDVLATSEYVLTGAKNQATSVNLTQKTVDDLDISINEISNNIGELSNASSSSASAIFKMTSSISDIASNSNNLSTTVNDTSSSIAEMSSSIKHVASRVEILSKNMTGISESAEVINNTLQHIGQKSSEASRLSLRVTKDAESFGSHSINRMITGMKDIEQSINTSTKVINSLGERSLRIGKVLTVIDEVTKQTNLLALNAAILAAQAGEQGKGFAVVADEIKNLADRTEASTGEISSLIKAVQDETTLAIKSIKNGAEKVQSGMLISDEANQALAVMLETAKLATSESLDISSSTNQLIKSVSQIAESIDESSNMSLQITNATKEQQKTTNMLMITSETMNQIAKNVFNKTDEQKNSSSMISELVRKTTNSVSEIVESINSQNSGTTTIKQLIEEIGMASQDAVNSTSSMSDIADTLHEHSAKLQAELDKFKLE